MTSQIYSYSPLEEEFDPNVRVTPGPTAKICRRLFLVLLFMVMAVSIVALVIMIIEDKPGLKKPPEGPTPPAPGPSQPTQSPGRSRWGRYRFGAVAADSEICSNIGTEILSRGSSIDAAITTMLCMCVVHPQACGIGGNFLATVYDSKSRKAVAMNARSVAALAATQDMFVNRTDSATQGGLSIAVPGEIAGYGELHQRFGRLPWSELFTPVINLCQYGFTVDKSLSMAIQHEHTNHSGTFLGDLILKSDGRNVTEDDVIKQPELAETFRRIADGGPQAFYNGSLADDIIADLQENGGIITKDDLMAYRALWKDTVSVTLTNGNYTLYGPPPPSSAVVAYYILNIMNGYDITAGDRGSSDKEILLAHRLIEAMKFGYGKRSNLGDEDFVNVTKWKELLESNEFAEETRQKIKDDTVLEFAEYDSSFVLPDDAGTAHLSVYGPDGVSVAITSTINTHFGSGVRGKRTGIIFNNDMDDFSTEGLENYFGFSPSVSNYIQPGKRPMSSMSPSVVVDTSGRTVAVVGASGGTHIITSVVQTLVNSLWLGYNVSDSVDQPRYHHQLLPDVVVHEPTLAQDILDGLAEKGHQNFTTTTFSSEFSDVQFIRSDCDKKGHDKYCLYAVSDSRRGGVPDGF